MLWGVSSAGLERLPVTQKVEGSSPLHPATNFYRRCNGGYIKVWPHRLMVRTPPFQGENPGSNPSGAARNQKHRFFSVFLISVQPPGLNRDRPECRRHAWPIREYTIRKIIKTEFVNTSFYRFLLLCIEASEWGCQKFKPTFWVGFLLDFQRLCEFVNWVVKTDTVLPICELFLSFVCCFCVLCYFPNHYFITVQFDCFSSKFGQIHILQFLF